MIFRYAESCRSLSWSMLATSCLTPAAYMSCYLALYLDDLRIFRPGLKRQGPAWETRQSCWWGHQNLALQELVYISHDVFDAYRKSHYKAGCHLGVLAEICEMCYTMLHHPQLNMEPDEGYFKVQCWRLGCVWGRGLSMFSPKISFFVWWVDTTRCDLELHPSDSRGSLAWYWRTLAETRVHCGQPGERLWPRPAGCEDGLGCFSAHALGQLAPANSSRRCLGERAW